jgi:signal transduction histidine kinase/CheY-like chemotaxis protein/PAS domain-containing protein
MDSATTVESAVPSFLDGGGELGRLIARLDWGATSLGAIARWPQVIKTTVGLILRSPVPIVTLWGGDGVMIYNDAYAVFAGGRHPQLLGSKVREGWPEVADFNDHVMKTTFLAGKTLTYEDQELTLHRNGVPEQVWMNLDYSPVVEDDGTIAGVIAIVVETSGKVRAERRISGEQERMRQMFEQAPGFMAMLEGPEHRFTMANAAYAQLIGGRDVLGKTVGDALPEIEAQGFIGLLDEVGRSRKPHVGFATPVDLDGPQGVARKYVDFIFQPLIAADGDLRGIFVQGHDVTDRKRAEILRTAHNRVLQLAIEDRSLAGALHELMLAVEQESESGVVASILLLDADGEHLRHGAGPSLPDAYNAAIDGIRIGDKVGSCGTAAHTRRQVFVSDIENDPLWADFKGLALEHGLRACWSTPILSGSGDVLGTFAMYHHEPREPKPEDLELVDLITTSAALVIERKRAEAALRELNETLEARVFSEIAERRAAEAALIQAQKLESIGKLTGGVAHDFNNLLQIISGNLQLLEMTVGGDEQAQRRIANALAGVERGAKLASHLLAFARRQPLAPKVVNISRLLGGMDELLRRSLGEAVEIETRVPDRLWNAFVDRNQTENALLNLAINARDAMGGSGRLTIAAANASVDERAAADRDVEPGDYIEISVGDTGSGMAPELLEQVFEPFFTTKPDGQGTGLGLSMVYGFVRQSGGNIRIESTPGEGTTVRLYLPRVDRSEDGAVAADLAEIGGGSETILVAEDDDEVRATAVAMLGELGYTVLTAKDAAEAFEMIAAGTPVDLLFTDVVMPGPMSSPELARKARERIPGLPVLFTSGYTRDAIVHRGRLDAGVELLAKPYTRRQLAARIRESLTRARAGA